LRELWKKETLCRQPDCAIDWLWDARGRSSPNAAETDAQFDAETERLIRADILRALPDPISDWDAPNGHLSIKRALLALAFVAIVACLKSLRLNRRRRNECQKRAFQRENPVGRQKLASRAQSPNDRPSEPGGSPTVTVSPPPPMPSARKRDFCSRFIANRRIYRYMPRAVPLTGFSRLGQ